MQIVRNSAFKAGAVYNAEHLAVVSFEQTLRAETLLRGCPLYNETPLHSFERLARRLGVRRVFVKDETARLGLSSFKALGGAYAVMLRSPNAPWCPRSETVKARKPPTFATATDGNHGISVAAGAWLTGSHSVCFLPEHVERVYEDSMQMLGAKVIRVSGNYDFAVAQAAATAAQNGWVIVSDTTEEPFNAVTCDVLSGYGVMVNECVSQLSAQRNPVSLDAVTHVFIQGGVGGLAAAVAGGLWQQLGASLPTFVIVEPASADCLYQSAKCGGIRGASGDLKTSMGMLSCGRPSRMAWTILKDAVEFFMTIDDAAAIEGVKACALEPAMKHETTPSGAAGLSGLIAAAESVEARARIGLDERSVVLAVCTERRPDRAALESLISTRRQSVRV